MKDSKSIQELIDGLNSGNLNDEESERLASSVKPGIPSGEWDAMFEKQWQGSGSSGVLPHSGEMLKLIHSRLAFRKERPGHTRRLYHDLFKYAALLIFAFFAGWIVNSLTGKIPDTPEPGRVVKSEISVDYGSKSKITLADGTRVKLNSGSKLTFPSGFSDGIREVDLEGEAFFEVVSDVNRPFVVNTGSIAIKALGTSFNIKSYPEENFIETTLVEGSVEIYNEPANGSATFTRLPIAVLKPSDKATFIKDFSSIQVSSEWKAAEDLPMAKKKAGIMIENEIETLLFTAWKDDVLRFKGEKFENIVVKLERWYDVKIDIRNNNLKEELFTGQFDTETIEQALEAIRLTAPFRYTIIKNEIVIY